MKIMFGDELQNTVCQFRMKIYFFLIVVIILAHGESIARHRKWIWRADWELHWINFSWYFFFGSRIELRNVNRVLSSTYKPIEFLCTSVFSLTVNNRNQSSSFVCWLCSSIEENLAFVEAHKIHIPLNGLNIVVRQRRHFTIAEHRNVLTINSVLFDDVKTDSMEFSPVKRVSHALFA